MGIFGSFASSKALPLKLRVFRAEGRVLLGTGVTEVVLLTILVTAGYVARRKVENHSSCRTYFVHTYVLLDSMGSVTPRTRTCEG